MGETDSVIANTVIGTDPNLEPSATEVAVTVTVRSLAGGVLGPVYVALKLVPETAALWLTLPHWDTLQETLHVTPLPEESPLMVAVSESVPVASIEFTLAVTATLMCGPINTGEPPPQLLSINAETTAKPAQRKLRSMISLSPRSFECCPRAEDRGQKRHEMRDSFAGHEKCSSCRRCVVNSTQRPDRSLFSENLPGIDRDHRPCHRHYPPAFTTARSGFLSFEITNGDGNWVGSNAVIHGGSE